MRRERAVDKSPWTYDAVLAPMELMWFSRWRKEVISKAHGDVLDIGSGTGINLAPQLVVKFSDDHFSRGKYNCLGEMPTPAHVLL